MDDFVIDDREWGVRGVVVDTRKWLPGGDVMVPVDLVDGVDWSSSRMTVKMDRAAVRQCPVVS